MNAQESAKQTGLKKSRKKNSLIGLTISFCNESSRSSNPVEEIAEQDYTVITGDSEERKKRSSAPPTMEVESSENNVCLSTMIRLSMNQLEKERTLLKQKEEHTSRLLQTERSMNAQLQNRIIELEDQIIDEPPTNTESDEVALKIKMLEAENELLKQKTKRQERTITNLAVDQQSELKQLLGNGTVATMRSSWSDLSLRAFLEDSSQRSHGEQWESLGERSFENMESSVPTGAKAQGEILQLRSTLGRTTKAYEKQTKELSGLKKEVQELRKQLGLDPKDTLERSLHVKATDRNVEGCPPHPTLEPAYRLSQSDINDMTLPPRELSHLLEF